MKRIRMYNVGFGDCFCLRDRKGSLLVDFGTSNKKIGKRLRDEVFDQVISDLSTIPKKSLLLSHFHPDHLSGLLYMINEREQAGEFATIYLPDVFSSPEMTKILTLQILADLMADSRLPGRQVSLTALLETLCTHPCRLSFLKRGMVFEQKYQTLWPDTDYIGHEVDEILASIPETLTGGWTVLYELAEQMRQVIWAMSDEGRGSELPSANMDAEHVLPWLGSANASDSTASNAAVHRESFLPDMIDGNEQSYNAEKVTLEETGEVLLKHFGQIRKSQDVVQLLHYFGTRQLVLRQFKHKISIVFQNQSDGELNVLFTGDIPSDYMQLIADNYDGRIPLHEHYWCIKIPHHGTESHYFDFSSYTPDNMLISNGIYYANSRKQEREARISGRYAGLFYIEDTTMYCSSSENCEGSRNGCGCSCREHEIIEPGYYRDI